MNAALMTDLGRALGCTESPASRPLPVDPAPWTSDRGRQEHTLRAVEKPRPRANSTDTLPESCYYSGPLSELGPAPAPHVRTALSWGYMDREASELAQRSREDLVRFFQMKARLKLRGRKAR